MVFFLSGSMENNKIHFILCSYGNILQDYILVELECFVKAVICHPQLVSLLYIHPVSVCVFLKC